MSEEISKLLNLLALLAEPDAVKQLVQTIEAAQKDAMAKLAPQEHNIIVRSLNLDEREKAAQKDRAALNDKEEQLTKWESDLAEKQHALIKYQDELKSLEAQLNDARKRDSERFATHNIKLEKDLADYVAKDAALTLRAKEVESKAADLLKKEQILSAQEVQVSERERAAAAVQAQYETKLREIKNLVSA